jgi:uncharacterized membrane protein YgdD (TMEM256/DUF423 family)
LKLEIDTIFYIHWLYWEYLFAKIQNWFVYSFVKTISQGFILQSGSLIILGTTLFSGACYYHAFTGDNKFGKLAPVGGTILIVGWLTMIL